MVGDGEPSRLSVVGDGEWTGGGERRRMVSACCGEPVREIEWLVVCLALRVAV